MTQAVAQQLTPEQFAWVLQVSARTVERWIARGKITCFKLGGTRRISPEAALEFIQAHTLQARMYRGTGAGVKLAGEDAALLWERIQRLIQTQMEAQKSFPDRAREAA